MGYCQGLSLTAVLELHPFVILSKLPNLSVAHLQNGNNHSTFLLGVLSGFEELIYTNSLQKCLDRRKHCIKSLFDQYFKGSW